ncbi:2-methoxy-6-polyprenyl-1,4-benzoquinol methylase, mitochondrial [Culicoides brevitarsis]|uniref:2-methoxy-6-polyprenyl-1,4-benzoquinol methylase, mitochondrial n=1 Tax=Culicoides brevitarsis TaxID=469753 RepID=UPI00307C7E28
MSFFINNVSKINKYNMWNPVLLFFRNSKHTPRVVRFISSSNYLRNNVQEEKETHFGFTNVSAHEKSEKVYKVFADVAANYDLMNDAMSFGIHRMWKDIFIQRLGPTMGTHLLDMAGGTGDISFRFANYLKSVHNKSVSPLSQVTIADINENMLSVGKQRAKDLKLDKLEYCKINWAVANAENLQFDDDSFSAYTIAFGIRNVTNIEKALLEAYRVLKPGGRFMCLEFSHLENKTLQWLYDQYSFQVIPPMGQILAGSWKPYQYLVESIRKFPNQNEFKYMIEEAGFKMVTYENLSLGICSIHSGFKL